MTESSLTRKTVRGTFWSYASFYSGKLMVFISTIILARLLTQEDFGIAGYAIVVISFLDVLADFGIGSALIYYREEPAAANTAFWLGMVISLIMFGVTWAGAPLAGEFFRDPRAVPVTRLLALNFPLSALGNIHASLLQRDLSFSKKFIPDVAKSFSKGLLSIGLALLGFGADALIIGQLAGSLVAAVVLWRVLPWRPSLPVDLSFSPRLLSYGGNIVAVNALGQVLTDSDYLLVGRFLNAALLGVYSVAFRIPDLLIMQFCSILSRVIFPVFTRIKGDAHALENGYLSTLRYVALVTVPLGLGMALTADPLVRVVFTEKWIDAVPVIQAISIYALLLSLSFNAGDVYKAQGRPQVLTIVSLVRAAILLPALVWAITGSGSLTVVGWTHAAVALVTGLMQIIVASRMLQMPLSRIGGALRPALVSGVLMAAAVAAGALAVQDAAAPVQLISLVAVGGVVYLGALWLFQREVLHTAAHTLRAALAG